MTHLPGCASSRNRPCTCPYLAQWTPTRLAGRGLLIIPDEMVHGALQHLDLDNPNTPIIISQSEYLAHHKEH